MVILHIDSLSIWYCKKRLCIPVPSVKCTISSCPCNDLKKRKKNDIHAIKNQKEVVNQKPWQFKNLEENQVTEAQ